MFERIRREGRVPESVKQRLLEHPKRQEIVDLLSERPGMNKNQICEELDVAGNVLDHHLDKLENQGQLVAVLDSALENEKLCFLMEDVDLWKDETTRILFGRRRSRAVAMYLAENPGRTTKEIAEALRISPVTVRHHIRTLRQYGLIHRFSAGEQKVYEPDETLESWVEEVGEAFDRPWEG